MDKIFLTQEELKTVGELNSQRTDLISKFGTIEFQIQTLELEKDKLTENLTTLNNKSISLGEELQKKYGEGNINIETGEFVKQ
jgi:predicted nuclease with TOPRIM domain